MLSRHAPPLLTTQENTGTSMKTTPVPKITQEILKEILHYDPDAGIFRWAKTRKKAKSGKVAGYVSARGYVVISINSKRYFAHRLAWLYVHGYFPENVIDHIDRNPSNNAISNLREVSQECNLRNCKLSNNNMSGVTGVCFIDTRGYYTAQITNNKKRTTIGCFRSKIDAVKARWDAEVKYGFNNCNTTSSARQYLVSHGIDVDNMID